MDINDNKKIIVLEKKVDSIVKRLQTIKTVLNSQIFKPFINFDNMNDSIVKSNDIRKIINKTYIEPNIFIKEFHKNISYVRSGGNGHIFKGNINGYEFAIKIVLYQNKEYFGDCYNKERPENVELLMQKVLSYFVLNNETPHILLPITTFYTNIKLLDYLMELCNITDENKKLTKILTNKNEYHDTVSILLNEWADAGDLLFFLRRKYKKLATKEWRVIFFQIISTLAVIQNKYPSFRHNDLKANNILITRINKDNTKFKYTINNMVFIVPNIGYQIKIADFDFACINKIVDNRKVELNTGNLLNINQSRNQYYDLHFFFNVLTLEKGFLHDFFKVPEISDKVKIFVRSIVPDEFSTGNDIVEKGRLLKNVEYTTPLQILTTNPFFRGFRTKKT